MLAAVGGRRDARAKRSTASFVRNFVWHDHQRGEAPFTPTDAVIAGDGRLYVTDQG